MSRRPRGVTVFAHLLHTHSAGTSVNIRHLRGARELRPIATDSNYDFNFQELRLMKQPANLRPVRLQTSSNNPFRRVRDLRPQICRVPQRLPWRPLCEVPP